MRNLQGLSPELAAELARMPEIGTQITVVFDDRSPVNPGQIVQRMYKARVTATGTHGEGSFRWLLVAAGFDGVSNVEREGIEWARGWDDDTRAALRAANTMVGL